MPIISASEWDTFITRYPNTHILQTSAWGKLKEEFGWRVNYVTCGEAGAQVIIKSLLPGINFAYIPKGPLGTNLDELWPEIDRICRGQKCVFLKVEPDNWLEDAKQTGDQSKLIPDDFILSKHSIQPLRTLIINIQGDEPQILGRMKQKTRYNINLALKKNIIIKPYTELSTFYDLMEITSQRDQFGIHSLAYYQRAYDLFSEHNLCQLLLAEYDNTPLAALIVFMHGYRSWYFYGASSNMHRDRMPNYLLQWEAMRWAKSQGCTEYDLWGVPDYDEAHLEANFGEHTHGLWGVYRFKRGFGGELRRSAGPWDRVYNPFLYRLYTLWLKYNRSEG